MKIRKGLEVDFSPRYERKVGDYVNQEDWDILRCSVHEVEDGSDIQKNKGKPIESDNAEKGWREHIKLQQRTLVSDLVPSVF